MKNFSFVFLIVLLVPAWCAEDGLHLCPTQERTGTLANKVESGEPEVKPEPECSRAGGICLPKKSCPPGKVSEEGHCPKQSHLGVVCCHDLPVTERRCVQLGGYCMASCPENLVISRATDCPKGEKCCILV